MKKLFLLLIGVGNLYADLVLEITQGSEQPVRLALIEIGGSSYEGNEVIEIVRNDLLRTGEFDVLTNDQLLSIPASEEDVIQRDWLLLEADAIIFMNIQQEQGALTDQT